MDYDINVMINNIVWILHKCPILINNMVDYDISVMIIIFCAIVAYTILINNMSGLWYKCYDYNLII